MEESLADKLDNLVVPPSAQQVVSTASETLRAVLVLVESGLSGECGMHDTLKAIKNVATEGGRRE